MTKLSAGAPGAIACPRTWLRARKHVIRDIDALLQDLRKRAGKGLQIGSGSSKLPGLINCDLYDPGADLKASAENLGMFADGAIDLIESHHMIEHLSLAETDRALAEWRRVLRANGHLVLTFPDLTAIALRWLKYSLAYPLFPRPDRMDYMVKMLVGSQEHEGMFHRNAFDVRRMSRLLENSGFEVEFTYSPYPKRRTPSRLVVARRR